MGHITVCNFVEITGAFIQVILVESDTISSKSIFLKFVSYLILPPQRSHCSPLHPGLHIQDPVVGSQTPLEQGGRQTLDGATVVVVVVVVVSFGLPKGNHESGHESGTLVRLFSLELCKLFCSLVRSRSSEQLVSGTIRRIAKTKIKEPEFDNSDNFRRNLNRFPFFRTLLPILARAVVV